MSAGPQRDRRLLLVLLVLTFVIAGLPLLVSPLRWGHDAAFHMNRLCRLADEYAAGNYAARIYHSEFGGIGYATGMFYGNTILVLPALLIRLGLSPALAYKLMLTGLAMLTALSMYFCAVTILKNRRAAFLAASVYVFSGYFATDLYARAAVGEVTAFACVPLAFTGLWSILDDDGSHALCLPVGLTLALFGHVLGAVMLVGVMGLYFLVRIRRVIAEPKRFFTILKCAGLFFLLSAVFMLPMLEQLLSDRFIATTGINNIYFGSLKSRALPWWALFTGCNEYWTMDKHLWHDWLPAGAGIVLLIVAAAVLLRRRKNRDAAPAVRWLALSAFVLFMCSKLFPWDLLQPVLGILQFPWRLMLFVMFFLALSAGTYFALRQDRRFFALVLAAALVTFGLNLWAMDLPTREAEVPDAERVEQWQEDVGMAEYLPELSADPSHNYRDDIQDAEQVFTASPGVTVTDETFGSGTADFSFRADRSGGEGWIEVPLLMYKGYRAELTAPDGTTQRLAIEKSPDNMSLIRVQLDGSTEGQIHVYYQGTPVQALSTLLSGFTLLGLIGFIAHKKHTERKLEQAAQQAADEFEILIGV